MQLTAKQLQRMAKGTPNASNVQSVLISINQYGARIGIDQPHRLAHFLAQELHESGGFRYDKELASGAAYEGRKDLGNTKKGDGVRFKGRGPEQLTGRSNYARFTKWVRGFIPDAPDFTVKPDLINTDPFEGLTAIWFWSVGNSTGRSLNVFADQNNIEMITRKVNGGLNGYDDRLDYFDRAAFVLLGYPLGAYKAFQTDARKKWGYDGSADGMPGPKTRAALFRALADLTMPAAQPAALMASPVVETKTVEKEVEVKVPDPVAVPVVTTNIEKPWYTTIDGAKEMISGGALTAVPAVTGAPWQTILAVGALAIIAGLAFYLIRRHHAATQAAVVKQIEAANTGALASPAAKV